MRYLGSLLSFTHGPYHPGQQSCRRILPQDCRGWPGLGPSKGLASVVTPNSGLGRAAQTMVLHRLHQARRDPLTLAWTRESFTIRGERLLARRAICLVVLTDINDFKAVNDTYGHEAADAALIAVAAALGEWCSTGGQVGRLGGDEFAGIRVVDQSEDPDALVAQLRTSLDLSFGFEGRQIRAAAAVGATLAFRGERLPAALSCADVALYAAKQTGGDWSLRVPGRGQTEPDRPRRYKRNGRNLGEIRQRPRP